jgi:hypothetical protein
MKNDRFKSQFLREHMSSLCDIDYLDKDKEYNEMFI